MLSDTRGMGAHQLSSHQIEELLEHADINGEGMVNYKEFIESTVSVSCSNLKTLIIHGVN